MQQFLNKLIPFLLLGIAVVAFAFGIMLLAYLFLFGAFIGLILFTINWVKQYFFPAKTLPSKKPNGRIIDSDEWRKM